MMTTSTEVARLTGTQIRRFVHLLELAHYDRAVEQEYDVRYFIDADVAVSVIFGFEVNKTGSTRERLFRALLGCGQIGSKFRMVRPHTLEMYNFVARKHKSKFDGDSYKRRVRRHVASEGIDEFLQHLRQIRTQYDTADAGARPALVGEFIDYLRIVGDDKFSAIEAARAPWRRRLRLFMADVVTMDSLGPHVQDRRHQELVDESDILRYLVRHSNRPHGSNYRDACALSMLSGMTKGGDGPDLVRFYSETEVVRSACKCGELRGLFEDRRVLQPESDAPPKWVRLGVFRDAAYFIMRMRFSDELGFGALASGSTHSLTALLRDLRDVRLDRLSESDIRDALAEVDRESVLGGKSLSKAIEEFEGLRLVKAIWTEDWLPGMFDGKRLGDWTDVFAFAHGEVTQSALDEQIDDIQATLSDCVSQLQGWFEDYDRIQRTTTMRWQSRSSSSFAIQSGILDEPVRDLGLDRWGVELTEEESDQLKDLVGDLYHSDSVTWHEACRSFATYVRSSEKPGIARIVCAALWILGQYAWIAELLAGRERRGEAVDLLVWEAAAWIRSASELDGLSAKASLERCRQRVDELRIAVREAGMEPRLALGLGYVMYHAWNRVNQSDLAGDSVAVGIYSQLAADSLQLARAAKANLAKHSVAWGLAVNHCVYVGIETDGDAELIMSDMRELIQLEAYEAWTARFADTAACYYMWRFEQDAGRENPRELKELLERSREHLEFAKANTIGDIAVGEHEVHLDQLKVQLRDLASDRST